MVYSASGAAAIILDSKLEKYIIAPLSKEMYTWLLKSEQEKVLM